MRTICFLILAFCSVWFGNKALAVNTVIKSPAIHLKLLKSTVSQVAKISNTYQEQAVITNIAVAEGMEYAADINDEDEDHIRTSGREQVLLVNYFHTFSRAFILSCLFNTIKSRIPNCGHLAFSSSCKYLTQRVLKI